MSADMDCGDVFLYSGPIERRKDLDFIHFVADNRKSTKLTLILVTGGGDPDAAYKMARYIQSVYDDFHCFVPGLCKSAGTLLAIGANNLIFSPYGELGPLDVQLSKTDDLFGQESGLNISEAFRTVEERARHTFHALIAEIIQGSVGVVSFTTASHCASEIVASLYGPIFGRIDPEEVGSRARAMRLGEDYGIRLNQKFTNLRDNGLAQLSQSYSSHGFVIDAEEASVLFERVRLATQVEKALVQDIGRSARFPNSEVKLENFTSAFEELSLGADEQENRDGHGDEFKAPEQPVDFQAVKGSKRNGGNPAAAGAG